MFRRGDAVPHVEVETVDGRPFSYSTIWQRKNLLLVSLPSPDSEARRRYAEELNARSEEFRARGAECVITRDRITGGDAAEAIVADKWGEIVFAAAAPDVSGLPRATELLDWVDHVRMRCPECEGEVK